MTARSNSDEVMLDAALAWQVALEGADADWDGYIAWLDADARHREAFDAVALTSASVAAHRAEIVEILAAQASGGRPGYGVMRRFAYIGGGIAAAIALFVAVPILWTRPSVQLYAAEDGSSREVMLANGIHVTLAPASRIAVHGKDAPQIDLVSGEAYFDVRHDPARSLTVSAGGYAISDIGTRFSVNISGETFRVGVSEGTVSIASARSDRNVQVAAGHQLVAGADGLTLSSVAVNDVGSWRVGRLSYTDTPISLVVADIARYSGQPVLVDRSLAKAHFSGTLVIGDGSKLLSDLSAVMGVEIRQDSNSRRLAMPASR